MKKRTISLVAMVAMLALSSPLYATGNYQKTTATNQNHELNVGQFQSQSADKLLGMSIESKNGENIGEIQDLQIDTNTGRINYVTVQVGGVMGIGGKEGIAVPLEAFRFSEDSATLTVDENKLKDGPKRAELSDADFQRNLESHYGVSPAWKDNRSDSTTDINANSSSDPMNNKMNTMDNRYNKKNDSLQDTGVNQKSQ